MPHTDFEEGVYTIASVKTPNLVFETRDGKAAVNQFIASEAQQWQIMSAGDGLGWLIQSLTSQKYIGIKRDDLIRDRYEIHEVDHKFPWHFKRDREKKDRVSICVPYTNHVIDLCQDNGGAKPGTILFIHGLNSGPHQWWYLCKDLHLAASKALKDGWVYRIVNPRAKTSIDINGNKVACFKAQDTPRQKFVAIETENGWAFHNAESNLYLGIPSSVVGFNRTPRLTGVPKKFTWIVLPHHGDNSKFKMWIPFTSRVIDLHNGSGQDDTPMHLHQEHDTDCQWWTFQRFPS